MKKLYVSMEFNPGQDPVSFTLFTFSLPGVHLLKTTTSISFQIFKMTEILGN